MKTPDEIKKGLECCHTRDADLWGCFECPYAVKERFTKKCDGEMATDALAYIQQLEADKAELLQKIKQLERERDAALRDTAIICETCLYNKPKYDGFKVRNECHNPEGCHYAAGLLCGWVWRGVCEENSPKPGE